LAILSICGAYGVPRERVAARDTWVPTVNGENFGELRARCAHERSRRAISTLANLHGGGGEGGREGEKGGLVKTRGERGGARGIYSSRFFPLRAIRREGDLEGEWYRKIVDTSKSIRRRRELPRILPRAFSVAADSKRIPGRQVCANLAQRTRCGPPPRAFG